MVDKELTTLKVTDHAKINASGNFVFSECSDLVVQIVLAESICDS